MPEQVVETKLLPPRLRPRSVDRAGLLAIQPGMAFLVDHLPPQVLLVVSTRADPALPLPRPRVRGDLAEILAADLADVATRESRTEGWAALQLAALSFRGRSRPSEYVAGFAGTDRFVVTTSPTRSSTVSRPRAGASCSRLRRLRDLLTVSAAVPGSPSTDPLQPRATATAGHPTKGAKLVDPLSEREFDVLPHHQALSRRQTTRTDPSARESSPGSSGVMTRPHHSGS